MGGQRRKKSKALTSIGLISFKNFKVKEKIRKGKLAYKGIVVIFTLDFLTATLTEKRQ